MITGFICLVGKVGSLGQKKKRIIVSKEIIGFA